MNHWLAYIFEIVKQFHKITASHSIQINVYNQIIGTFNLHVDKIQFRGNCNSSQNAMPLYDILCCKSCNNVFIQLPDYKEDNPMANQEKKNQKKNTWKKNTFEGNFAVLYKAK